MNRFSIREAISFGWVTTKANLGLFIGLTVVLVVVSGLGGAVSAAVPILGWAASLILDVIITMGVIRILLKFVDGGKGEFQDLWANFDMILDYIGAAVLYSLITIAGLILLIVPGIIWGIKYSYFGFLIVDKRCRATEALRQSAALTQGAKWQLFLLGLAFFGINLLGALCFGIGLLVTIPVTWLASAFVYRRLQGNPAESLEPLIR